MELQQQTWAVWAVYFSLCRPTWSSWWTWPFLTVVVLSCSNLWWTQSLIVTVKIDIPVDKRHSLNCQDLPRSLIIVTICRPKIVSIVHVSIKIAPSSSLIGITITRECSIGWRLCRQSGMKVVTVVDRSSCNQVHKMMRITWSLRKLHGRIPRNQVHICVVDGDFLASEVHVFTWSIK